jgi:predicted nucleotidyltransferase
MQSLKQRAQDVLLDLGFLEAPVLNKKRDKILEEVFKIRQRILSSIIVKDNYDIVQHARVLYLLLDILYLDDDILKFELSWRLDKISRVQKVYLKEEFNNVLELLNALEERGLEPFKFKEEFYFHKSRQFLAKELIKVLSKYINIEKVYVFGSFIKRHFDIDSDIDLYIEGISLDQSILIEQRVSVMFYREYGRYINIINHRPKAMLKKLTNLIQ